MVADTSKGLEKESNFTDDRERLGDLEVQDIYKSGRHRIPKELRNTFFDFRTSACVCFRWATAVGSSSEFQGSLSLRLSVESRESSGISLVQAIVRF